MRSLIAATLIALGTMLGGAAQAADLPPYTPPPQLPPPDYGFGGAFYLRGTIDVNALYARDADYGCGCTTAITDMGYGYSFGVGIGYESSDGLRWDATLDRIVNYGLSDGADVADVTTTLGMMNAYYDFGFNGGLPTVGEWGGYVGAGLGMAYNQVSVPTTPALDGASFGGAAAVMAGVTYDMGPAVADLGYRAVYMPTISNGQPTPLYINQNIIHEMRGTLRYRFN